VATVAKWCSVCIVVSIYTLEPIINLALHQGGVLSRRAHLETAGARVTRAVLVRRVRGVFARWAALLAAGR